MLTTQAFFGDAIHKTSCSSYTATSGALYSAIASFSTNHRRPHFDAVIYLSSSSVLRDWLEVKPDYARRSSVEGYESC